MRVLKIKFEILEMEFKKLSLEIWNFGNGI